MKPEEVNKPGASDRLRREDAETALRAFFETSLAEASDARDPIDFDAVAAYVDGTMADIDREIFETRLADDATLQADVADLTAMRAAVPRRVVVVDAPGAGADAGAARGAGRLARAAGSKSSLWILGMLAAAAGLAGAGAVIWRAATAVRHPTPADSTSTSVSHNAPPAPSSPASASPATRVALRDAGGVVRLDESGTITAPVTLPDSLVPDAVAALRAGTLPEPALPAAVRSRGPLTLLNGSQPSVHFGVMAPVATLVREARPTFQWQAHPRATAYTVTIVTDALDRVATSPTLHETGWTPDVDLKAGITYQWQVTAITPDGPETAPAPPLAEARFAILPPTQRHALDRRLADVGSSNLLRGLVLTRAGLLGDAERAFAALAAENRDSAVASQLLTAARKLHGQGE